MRASIGERGVLRSRDSLGGCLDVGPPRGAVERCARPTPRGSRKEGGPASGQLYMAVRGPALAPVGVRTRRAGVRQACRGGCVPGRQPRRPAYGRAGSRNERVWVYKEGGRASMKPVAQQRRLAEGGQGEHGLMKPGRPGRAAVGARAGGRAARRSIYARALRRCSQLVSCTRGCRRALAPQGHGNGARAAERGAACFISRPISQGPSQARGPARLRGARRACMQ
ncbi:MAG: hypothetical protein J3K34DRAFT_406496 [Monoraphidium minutum]|nr:MAG: hypothetical protein J3K34DRAFT_406496 [Monoraphidium minutum]